MQRSAGFAAAVVRAAASAASEEEEDLRSNSNSSTASVVSSSSSLHLAHKQQQQQQQQQQHQQQLHHGGQLQQQQQQQHETAARSSRKKKTKRDDLCDACKAKPAVWFCPADDAYLCHACDRSVHSANAFSLRHERVSLQVVNPVTAASIKEGDPPAEGRRDKMEVEDDDKEHSSSGKNKRPRRNLSSPSQNNRMLKALDEETTSPGPKNCSHGEKDREEAGDEEEEEELTHTVPVFVGDDDPARSIGEEEQQHSGIATDLGDSEDDDEESDDAAYVDRFLNDDHQSGGEEVAAAARQERQRRHTRKKPRGDDRHGKGNSTAGATCQDLNGLLGLRRSTLEDELHDDDDGDERFGFAIRKEQAIRAIPEFGLGMDGGDGIPDGRIKEEQQHYNAGLANDDFFLKPCRDATILGDILGLKLAGDGGGSGGGGYERDLRQIHTQHLQRRICLRLDYEDVLNAWSDRRPFLTDSSSAAVAAASARLFDDSTSDAAGSSDVGVVPDLSSAGSRRSGRPCAVEQPGRVPVVAPLLDGPNAATAGGEAAAAATGAAAVAAAAAASTESGGREARVSRYREKRRTRLFSKKIRYEVRKLNAERRPRLKGRFVKRLPVG